MCIGCDKRLTIEHILLTCSDFIEIRESHVTAKSLRMLFQDISPEKIFNFFEINSYFWKNLNLRSFLVMFVFPPFKHGFKNWYIDPLQDIYIIKNSIYMRCVSP